MATYWYDKEELACFTVLLIELNCVYFTSKFGIDETEMVVENNP